MQAHVGDWIVVESTQLGGHRREGQVVGLRHSDGSPPYLVRWLDTGTVTLTFPGAHARVLSLGEFEQLAARHHVGRQPYSAGRSLKEIR